MLIFSLSFYLEVSQTSYSEQEQNDVENQSASSFGNDENGFLERLGARMDSSLEKTFASYVFSTINSIISFSQYLVLENFVHVIRNIPSFL